MRRQFTVAFALGRFALCALAILLPCRSAFAEECKLDPVPIDLVQNNEGPLLASIIFNGKPMVFRLSTGQFWSSIRPEYAEGLTHRKQQVCVVRTFETVGAFF